MADSSAVSTVCACWPGCCIRERKLRYCSSASLCRSSAKSCMSCADADIHDVMLNVLQHVSGHGTTMCENSRQHVPDTLWQPTHNDWMLCVKGGCLPIVFGIAWTSILLGCQEYDGCEAEDPAEQLKPSSLATPWHNMQSTACARSRCRSCSTKFQRMTATFFCTKSGTSHLPKKIGCIQCCTAFFASCNSWMARSR